MMNKSTMRIAATAAAIACATAAGAQLTLPQKLSAYVPETRLVVATEPGAPPEAVAKMEFEVSQATVEEPLEPVRLVAATPAAAPALPARLPDTAGWTPLLVVFGVLALIGGFLLMTRRRLRPAPWESDETEASTARDREERFAEELKVLWDKTTTTETLRPRDEAQPPLREEKH